MRHGNNPALEALDLLEQRIKQDRANAQRTGDTRLLPGLDYALYLLRDTADDVAPRLNLIGA